ncbi:hypothetical protein FNF31_05839 [Cafeteria roenbergensis]|uniref:O-GlcNAc transferase C-terminal domain-containing protein n=1 Tax=Cafeteria roenbergensis TaxID=33653 RepID=A0A5A8CV04_CAFRO|nr:hypothetical protein FNF31_05839 [Cafeteria roenbergensis]
MELGGVPGAWGAVLLAVQVGSDSVSTSTLSLEVHLRVAMRVQPRPTANRVIGLSEALLGPLSPSALAGSASWPGVCDAIAGDGRLERLQQAMASEPALLQLLNTRFQLGASWSHSLNRTDALATKRVLVCLSPRSASRLGKLAEVAQEQGSLVEASASAAALARLLLEGSAAGRPPPADEHRPDDAESAKALCMAALSLGQTEQARLLGPLVLSRRVMAECGAWVRSAAGTLRGASQPRPGGRAPARPSLPLHVGYVTRDIASPTALQQHPVAPILLGLLRSHGDAAVPSVHYTGLASSLTVADLAATHETRRPHSIVERLCAQGSGACCPPGSTLASCTPAEALGQLCSAAGLVGTFGDIACQARTLIHAPAEPASGSLYGDVCGAGPLDVAVDLQGLTMGMEPALLRSLGRGCPAPAPREAPRRLAPVVVESVGYVGSTGLSNVHYVTADTLTIAVERAWAGSHLWFTESALLLPRAQQPPGPAYRRPRAGTQDVAAPGRPIVVASLASARKSLESVTVAWGRALALLALTDDGQRRRPGSGARPGPLCPIELWVRRWPSRGGRVADCAGCAGKPSIVGTVAAASGFPPWCIRGVGHAPSHAEYLGMLRRVDVFLDSPVYGSHTTAIDALSQGATVLAWQGAVPQGRLPASIAAQSSREAGRSMIVRSAKELALVLRRMANPAVASGLRRLLLSGGGGDGTLFDLAEHGRAWQRALALVKEVQAGQAGVRWWRPRRHRPGYGFCEGSRRFIGLESGGVRNCEAGDEPRAASSEPSWRPLHVVVDPLSDWRRRA